MQDNLMLSICIPTYNRSTYLKAALNSIFSQVEGSWNDSVEVCVSDNASTDDTESVVSEFQTDSRLRVIYRRNEQNLGADRNYLRVIELATGKYCWFLGSDDVIKPGAIAKILSELHSAPEVDIFVCSRTAVELKTLTPIADECYLDEGFERKIFNFSKRSELLEYFTHSSRLASVFAYISSIVFRREKWNSVHGEDAFIGTAYVHAYKLLSFIPLGCLLKYIYAPLVFARMGQDSFASDGVAKRVLLDLNGYEKIADTLFHDSEVKNKFMGILSKEYPLISVVRVCERCSLNEWKVVRMKFVDIGISRIILCLAELIRYPFHVARFVKHIIFNRSGLL
jgi:abequosyltransferase